MTTADNSDRHMPVRANMSYDEMLRVLEDYPIHVDEYALPEHVCGLYDESIATIAIDANMIEVQKKCTLVHELFHWVHADDSCEWLSHKTTELRTQRETAIMMINQTKYIAAEREYDGEHYLIACELDVTVSLVDMYRSMLEGHQLPIRYRNK